MSQQYHKILVAVDGSDEAELAFTKAVNVAKRNQGELLLAHIIDTRAFQTMTNYDSSLADQATSIAEQTLKEYAKRARDNGVEKVSYVIEYGSPKLVIAKQLPTDQDIDLIMLGATGLNAVERILMGSVSEYVIRNAQCDVLVVRTDLDNRVPKKQKNK